MRRIRIAARDGQHEHSTPSAGRLGLELRQHARSGQRLDALKQAQLDTKAEVRILFGRLADRFGVQTPEVDRAMDSIDDTISDLVYEVESDLEQEIDERQERD